MRVVSYCNIALYIKLSLLDDLLIPLTLLTDFLLFGVLSFSGNRGIGVSRYRGIVCRCAATIIVGTAATLL